MPIEIKHDDKGEIFKFSGGEHAAADYVAIKLICATLNAACNSGIATVVLTQDSLPYVCDAMNDALLRQQEVLRLHARSTHADTSRKGG